LLKLRFRIRHNTPAVPRAMPPGDRVIREIAVDRSRIMPSAVAVVSLTSFLPTFGFGLPH
jgi:hypothetical protein